MSCFTWNNKTNRKIYQKNLINKTKIKKINLKSFKLELIKILNFRDNYFYILNELINLDIIKTLKLKIVINVIHGASRAYLYKFLFDSGLNIKVSHKNRDPSFDGHHSEPSVNFSDEVIDLSKKEEYDIAIPIDKDAYRFGIIDKGCIY